METPTCPWVTAEDRAPLGPAPAPYAVTASYVTDSLDLGTSVNCHSGSAATTLSLSTVAPAIQAVITLNLTSSQDLTYLLAGLMDNNTTMSVSIGHQTYYSEGLNGYFLPVTGQLSTLGLSRVVMGTLANTSATSGGVGGAPYSLVFCVCSLQPSDLRPGTAYPLGLFDFFAGIWNSFAGDFATLLQWLKQDVVGLAGIVWNAVVAATVYFAHIVQGLTHLVAYAADWVVKTTVSDLETVGSALRAVMQALLAFVKAEITTFLTRVMGPIASAVQDMTSFYADPVFSGLDPSPGLGAAVFGSTMNELLIVGAAITTSLFVATGIITGLSFGVGDVILFVAPLLITLAFEALKSNGPTNTAAGNLIGQPIGSAIWGSTLSLVDTSVNAAANAENQPLDSNAQNSLSTTVANIRTSADLTAALTAFGASIGLYLAKLGGGSGAKIANSAIGLGIAIASFMLFGYLLTTTNSNWVISTAIGQMADVLSAGLATLAAVFVAIAIASHLPEPFNVVFGITAFFIGVVITSDVLLYLPVLESM